ncbi:energy-coupling factor ABC transporter substrate-binding protein [Cutibacterium sp.]|uniref:energy-coupling factor ABC transporter substrate-binding protein n=1 Tax=Cutibacterium sp. TaxID=1912221 RepID=UPI0026DC3F05|nr:energy-coupling factor ABC transporter substrate-binding protein [Cutibacterium sp.]MDO4412886.1 energy-coupling factor ABC transporter substrate-binding protein [Cutibacterium sp.]
MPDNAAVQNRVDRSLTSNSKWVTPVIIILLVALFVVSMVLGAKKVSGDEEGFGGTDDAAATAAEEAGAKEWIKPIFEPNSGEVESGLFAMQAALGAGIAGYALGRMSGKKKGREEAEHASDLHSVDDVPEAVTSSEVTATTES